MRQTPGALLPHDAVQDVIDWVASHDLDSLALKDLRDRLAGFHRMFLPDG
jgi:hypothetical protein